MIPNIPEETLRAVEAMLEDKRPYTEIQEKWNVSSKTIAAIAKETGLTRRDKISQWIERYLCDLKKAGYPEYTAEELWSRYSAEKKHYGFQDLDREAFAVKVSRVRSRLKNVKDIEGQLKSLPAWSELKGSELQAENVELKAKLIFLNEFFKANSDYLFKSKKIQEFVVNHPEFDEVEQLCQA